jgi:hypothetical protein
MWQCERCGLGRAETSGFDPNTYYTAGLFLLYGRTIFPVGAAMVIRTIAVPSRYCAGNLRVASISSAAFSPQGGEPKPFA